MVLMISIHAPREGGDHIVLVLLRNIGISIHAPREGGDVHKHGIVERIVVISIHAPREGGDKGGWTS